MKTAVDSPASSAVTTGVSVAARTGRPVTGLRARYEAPLLEGGGQGNIAWATFTVDGGTSAEVQWFEDGLLYLGL